MQSNRSYTESRKARIVLDKTFPVFRLLNIGDKGQLYLNGSIIAERIDTQDDGTELYIKTIQIDKVELIENKESRATTSRHSI